MKMKNRENSLASTRLDFKAVDATERGRQAGGEWLGPQRLFQTFRGALEFEEHMRLRRCKLKPTVGYGRREVSRERKQKETHIHITKSKSSTSPLLKTTVTLLYQIVHNKHQ